MLMETSVGFFCIQTVLYIVWDALHGVWTWRCMFQANLLRNWWYLVPQHALDYFDLLELFAAMFWLAKAN